MLRAHEIDLIFLVAPTSTDERLKMIAERASGFIYAVSRAGVTGAREDISVESREVGESCSHRFQTPRGRRLRNFETLSTVRSCLAICGRGSGGGQRL
jgi:tryptophan synthase alpha subunit